MDSFYIKIFCIISIIVVSILSLDYLLKYLITLYFRNNKNFSICDHSVSIRAKNSAPGAFASNRSKKKEGERSPNKYSGPRKIVYEYLNNLKIISEKAYSYNRFFLINFIIYLIILLLLITILIII